MIFRMKQLLISIVLLVSISTIGNGQNTMKLDEYTICSSQLDSIINMVLNDVENEDYIDVYAEKNENNIYTIYVSAFLSSFLRYSSNIIGYAHKGNVTILFHTSVKDMVTKKTDSHKISFRCIPPPKKNDIFSVIAKDGLKEWYFNIDNGEIIFLRKFLEW